MYIIDAKILQVIAVFMSKMADMLFLLTLFQIST